MRGAAADARLWRENLCPDPRQAAAGTGYGTSGTILTRGVVVPPTPGGVTTATRCTTPAPTTKLFAYVYLFSGVDLRPHRFAFQVRASVDAKVEVQSDGIGAWAYQISAMTWTRLAITVGLTGTAYLLVSRADGAVASGDEWADFTEVLAWRVLTPSDMSAPGPFADGDSPGWSWVGTPGASASHGWGPLA